MKLKLKNGTLRILLRYVHYKYNNSYIAQAKHYLYASEERMRKYMYAKMCVSHIIKFTLISAKKKKHIFSEFLH